MVRSAHRPLPRIVVYLLLLLIVLSGFTLRVWHVNFDRGIGSHPDERSTACFYATQIHLPASWEELRDPHRSPLNPLWNVAEQTPRKFTYGHLPLYLGVAFGEVLHTVAPLAAQLGLPAAWTELMARADQACDAIAVAGRLVIASLDTLTILLLYLLTRRIYNRGAGLLAAAFYAFAAQAVQLSHFFAMDPASTTFTVLAILGAVQMVQDRNWRAVAVAGVGAGLAIASKFSALPILAAPVVAGILILWDEWQRARQTGEPANGPAQWIALAGIPCALLIAALTFFVTSPYAVLDWPNFVQPVLVEQGAMVRGVADMPFTRQYRNTTPYLYFIDQQLRWGLGWPLGLLAAAGTVYATVVLLWGLWQIVASLLPVGRSAGTSEPSAGTAMAAGESSSLYRQERRSMFGPQPSREALALIVVWSWVLPYFAITGAFLAKFNRYMSPLLPFVLLFAAGLVWRLWTYADERTRTTASGVLASDEEMAKPSPRPLASLWRGAALLLALVGLVGGLFWSAAYVNGVYNREHTWITAARWLFTNAPRGSVVLFEQWDDGPPYSIPGEPGMDQGSVGITTTNWGPYEEDTAEKYEILKQKLREANYVWYSSKRIYGSVDELPERYPLTTRYYAAMWAGKLGYELALDVTSPPQLFGWAFQDRGADESWSLYDHPQVTVFRKVRDLSDAEFDAVLGGSWDGAIPYYRGKDSPLSPLLDLMGLGSRPETQDTGLINKLIALATGKAEESNRVDPDRPSLLLGQPLASLPVVDNYRWNRLASERPALAVLWWWFVLLLVGWAAWPLAFYICRPLRDRGYLLSRTLGWLLAGWLLWWLASRGWAMNSVVNAWLALGVVGVLGAAAAIWQWSALRSFLRRQWPVILFGEALFAAAYLFFLWIRLYNPDLWQPWFGGEKFMEFAFLNGILRSPQFPPVDPHFAGGYINYYYFGLYLVAYLIKLTGIYAEVAFNLAIPTLFALTAVNSFAVAYSAVGGWSRATTPASAVAPAPVGPEATAPTTDDTTLEAAVAAEEPAGDEENPPPVHSPPPAPALELNWRTGLWGALLAPLFVSLIGNLDGFAQLVRNLAQVSGSQFSSASTLVQTIAAAAKGLTEVLAGRQSLPGYDFWGPSRVIPETINEFPYWSFLYADLHAHVIGIPLALLFLGLAYVLIAEYRTDWQQQWERAVALLAAFGLLLGALASVNLWELPTYFGLGVLALLVSQVRRAGKINWWQALIGALGYLGLAYLLFLPFFRHYVGVGASGVGWVSDGDEVGRWLLIWGLFVFILFSWLWYAASRPLHRDPAWWPDAARPRALRAIAAAAPLGLIYSPGALGAPLGGEESIAERAETVQPTRDRANQRAAPLVGERWLSQALRFFDRLPRLIALQRTLVQRPGLAYLLTPTVVVLAWIAAGLAWFAGRTVLALCLAPLGIAVVLLWRRSREADPATLLVTLLTATGLAVLAGTQLIYLKDFMSGGSYYRMNTVFKFFSQVWVLWGVAAAIGLAQLAKAWFAPAQNRRTQRWLVIAWGVILALLLVASLAYPIYGTRARLDMRMVGWRPPFGTLNGLDYMRQGSYTWRGRDATGQELPETLIELRYDWPALEWLLDNVRGNAVIIESAEKDYYRAGGTRAASFTGLSGLSGMHEGEQRYDEELGPRNQLHQEFWNTLDVPRTQQIIADLDIALIYAGQLEQYLHPAAVEKLAQMARQGLLTPVYSNERTVIYAVPGRLIQTEAGYFVPQ